LFIITILKRDAKLAIIIKTSKRKLKGKQKKINDRYVGKITDEK
jgi:hypothetical protein